MLPVELEKASNEVKVMTTMSNEHCQPSYTTSAQSKNPIRIVLSNSNSCVGCGKKHKKLRLTTLFLDDCLILTRVVRFSIG